MIDHPLRRVLGERELTQRQAADLLGITEVWVNSIVTGRVRASRDLLDKLRATFAIAPTDVMDWEGEHLRSPDQPAEASSSTKAQL